MESAGSPVYLVNLVNFIREIPRVAVPFRLLTAGRLLGMETLHRVVSYNCGEVAGWGRSRAVRAAWAFRRRSRALRCGRCGDGPTGLRESFPRRRMRGPGLFY